jgi:hypothetical protein
MGSTKAGVAWAYAPYLHCGFVRWTLVRICATRLDQSGVSLDLTHLDTDVMLPVRCHFELDSMTIAVPGPWELTWNLGAP